MVNKQLEELAQCETEAVKESLIANRSTEGYHLLSLAFNTAEQGDECKTRQYLQEARDYCNNNGMIFPDNIAAEIKTTATVQDWRDKEELRQRRLRNEKVRSDSPKKSRIHNFY